MHNFHYFTALTLCLTKDATSLFSDVIDFSSFPAFSALRTCGNCCLCAGTNCTITETCIAKSVGCHGNTCLCSPGSHSLAVQYLDVCVAEACTNDSDAAVQSYQQVFGSYCQSVASATASSTSLTSTASTPTGKKTKTRHTNTIPLRSSSHCHVPLQPLPNQK
jgi:hypothetical protein